MTTNTLLSFAGAAALALVACGGDDTTTSTSTTASSSASTMDSASSSGQGGSGQGGNSATATTSTSSGQGGSGGDAGTTVTTSGGQGGAGGGGSPDPMVNGCTLATAKDMTGMKSVTITDIAKWTFGHQACVLLTGGTQVVWDGDFNTHPLTGGESGKADLASPISMAMVNGTTATALIPVEQGKAYPYFCSKHPSMQGVIYTK